MLRLIVATGNAHKVQEIRSLLAGAPVEVASAEIIGGMPPVVEDADSFVGNARLKARALHALADPTDAVLADDSGLAVQVLAGAPGVYSARYAGPGATDAENNRKLLEVLKDYPAAARKAAFVCSLVFLSPEGNERVFEGHCQGRIGFEPLGTEGFGYDPLFIPEGHADTFGLLGARVKSKLSHRAAAVSQLREFLMPGALANGNLL